MEMGRWLLGFRFRCRLCCPDFLTSSSSAFSVPSSRYRLIKPGSAQHGSMKAVSFVFRNRILFGRGVSITSELASGHGYMLWQQQPDGPVVMILKDWLGDLVLFGENFPSPEAAIEAAKTWRQHLTVALARAGIGANLGNDSDPWFPESFERAAAAGKEGVAVVDTGLIVHESGAKIMLTMNTKENPWQPRPSAFSRTEPAKKPLEALLDGPVADVSCEKYTLTQQQILAFSLLHNSYFEANPETKTVTLTTAVEALINPSLRSAEVVETLDALKKQVMDDIHLSVPGKDTILNALGNMKRQSINEAAQSLAGQLLTKNYDGLTPDKFFKRTYADRCNLVHGSAKRPPAQLLQTRNPILAAFVADLLDASVFGKAT